MREETTKITTKSGRKTRTKRGSTHKNSEKQSDSCSSKVNLDDFQELTASENRLQIGQKCRYYKGNEV